MTDTTETSGYACSAYGCPAAASRKKGADWVCMYHGLAQSAGAWQKITNRLNLRKAILNAIARAESIGPYDWAKTRHIGAAEAMRKIGREDLAPRIVTRVHAVYGIEVQRDEREHRGLWVERLQNTLIAECVDAVPEPQQEETRAGTVEPQTVGNLFPSADSVAAFVSDDVEVHA